MGMETPHKSLLRGSGQGCWRAGMGRDCLGAVAWDGLGARNSMGAGKIWDLCHGMDWEQGILWVQEGLFPVPTILKRSLPFFTWIAEPWPCRWTTAGCKESTGIEDYWEAPCQSTKIPPKAGFFHGKSTHLDVSGAGLVCGTCKRQFHIVEEEG